METNQINTQNQQPTARQNSFNANWQFQAGFYPQIKDIIMRNAMYFIRIDVADQENDLKHATDFVVTVVGGDVAVRVRRADKPYRDLTIRSFNRGLKTEIHKIKEGYARFYLYCWEDEQHNLSEWAIIDMDLVRKLKVLDNRMEISNKDGRTKFVAVPMTELKKLGCLVSYKSNKVN